jgi:TorA maturation chaperone TorD
MEEQDETKTNNQESAAIFVNAIKALANNPNNLDNLESYLSWHFDKWLERYAHNPESLAGEMKNFAEME